MPHLKLGRLLLAGLKKRVARVTAKVPFYSELYAKAGVLANDMESLEDIAKLPFTNKQDLRDRYPFGMFAVPVDLRQSHATSGTTVILPLSGYTANDTEVWVS